MGNQMRVQRARFFKVALHTLGTHRVGMPDPPPEGLPVVLKSVLITPRSGVLTQSKKTPEAEKVWDTLTHN